MVRLRMTDYMAMRPMTWTCSSCSSVWQLA